jgi:uncharacterized PurR-regulated membrane protein YhhQ (DUF165 family)
MYMMPDLIKLAASAIAVYALVLLTHSLRNRYGLAFIFGLLGGLTAIMSLITDTGAALHFGDITFMVGSTVFYTSLLLAVFVIYVFDGPGFSWIGILIIAGVSILTPLTANIVLNYLDQAAITGHLLIPSPSLRINAASVITTVLDMFFLAIAWEWLGKSHRKLRLWLRTLLTFFGLMCFDVLLFNTGAFLGTERFLSIMQGTLYSRLIIAAFAFPVLYIYLLLQNRRPGAELSSRPVLSILTQITQIQEELDVARIEIQRRAKAESENAELVTKLKATIARVQKLEGLLPVCSYCGKIRIESDDESQPESWIPVDKYLREETQVLLSHGICPDCMKACHPEVQND